MSVVQKLKRPAVRLALCLITIGIFSWALIIHRGEGLGWRQVVWILVISWQISLLLKLSDVQSRRKGH